MLAEEGWQKRKHRQNPHTEVKLNSASRGHINCESISQMQMNLWSHSRIPLRVGRARCRRRRRLVWFISFSYTCRCRFQVREREDHMGGLTAVDHQSCIIPGARLLGDGRMADLDGELERASWRRTDSWYPSWTNLRERSDRCLVNSCMWHRVQ